VGFHSNHFPLGLFSLVFALNVWLAQPAWALEDNQVFVVYDGYTRTPMRVQTFLRHTVSSKAAASQHWKAYPGTSTNPSSAASSGAAASQRYGGAAAAAGSDSSNPQSKPSKYQVGSTPDGSNKPPIPPLQFSGLRGSTQAEPPKKKKSSVQQAREDAAAAATGVPPSRHSHRHSVARKSLSSAVSSGAAAPQPLGVQSRTRVSLSSVASIGSASSGQLGTYSVTRKGLSSGESSESPSKESPPSQSSDSPSIAHWSVSSPPSSGASTPQGCAAAGAGAVSPSPQSQSLKYEVVESSRDGNTRSADPLLSQLTDYLHTDPPQPGSSKQKKPSRPQAAAGTMAAPVLVPQKAVIIDVQSSLKPKPPELAPTPQNPAKRIRKAFLSVPGKSVRIQPLKASVSPWSPGWAVREVVVPSRETTAPVTEIDIPLPSRPEMRGMFGEADKEGLKLKSALAATGSLDCFKVPRFLRGQARVRDSVYVPNVLELVISYLYGDLLAAHGEERDSVLKRLIEERHPKPIRYQLSRHNSGDHRFREEDFSYDANDIMRKVKGIFVPEEDMVLRDISKTFPYFTYHSKKLAKIWPFVRPGRLFKMMGEIICGGVAEMIHRNHWEQVDVMSAYALDLCLLARRYECRGTRHLARYIYKQLNHHYNLRVSTLKFARNGWTEVLLEEMRRFIRDLRFWEGDRLDFNIETAL
jgi:hypothetical protein